MSENALFVVDDGDLRKYRTEVPNMVYEMGLTPHALALYGHIKRVAGDSGVCFKGIRTLAKLAGMSAGRASAAKSELERHGLIRVKEGDRKRGEADELRAVNIWARNFRHFDETPNPKPAETPCSEYEHPPRSQYEHGQPACSEYEHPRETCSQYEHKKEPYVPIENPSNEGQKKPSKVKSLTKAEAHDRFEALCESDPQGNGLRELAQLLAEENKTGEVAVTKVWRELGARFADTRSRHDLSEDAWAYGFERALVKAAPNIGYVLKAAKGYESPGSAKRAGRRNSIAVIGATDADYNEEEYRFHG